MTPLHPQSKDLLIGLAIALVAMAALLVTIWGITALLPPHPAGSIEQKSAWGNPIATATQWANSPVGK